MIRASIRSTAWSALTRVCSGTVTSCSSTSSHSSPSVATHFSSVVSFMLGHTALLEAGMNLLSGYSMPSR